MAKVIKITDDGLKKLEEELEYLKTEGRADIAEKIKVARGYGDLSENSEYDEAKSEQAKIEARINELEYQLDHAEIIDVEDADAEIKQLEKEEKEVTETTQLKSSGVEGMKNYQDLLKQL